MLRLGPKQGCPLVRRRRGQTRSTRRVVGLLAVALTCMVIVGCGSNDDASQTTATPATNAGAANTTADEKQPYTVGLMVIDLKNAFFADQAAQVREMVEQAGGKFVVMDPGGDPAKQLQTAQDWLNAGKVDAIVGSLVDVGAFQPALDEAAQKRVPVVLLGQEPKKFQSGQASVTQDYKDWGIKIGKAAAKCIDDRLGGKGEVTVLDWVGFAGPIVPTLLAGEKEGLATNPGAKVVAQPDAPSRLKALQAMQDVLRAHPGVNVVVGTTDETVIGALQALKGAGKDPKKLCLVATNGTDEALRLLGTGDLYGAVDARLPLVYGTALRAAWAMIKNPDDPAYSKKLLHTNVGMRYHEG